jgi:hypothetical protein
MAAVLKQYVHIRPNTYAGGLSLAPRIAERTRHLRFTHIVASQRGQVTSSIVYEPFGSSMKNSATLNSGSVLSLEVVQHEDRPPLGVPDHHVDLTVVRRISARERHLLSVD